LSIFSLRLDSRRTRQQEREKMPLIRGHHSFDDHFTQIPNSWLRDRRLSLKAIGLLAQLISHAPGWSLSINSLASYNGVSKDSIRTAIKELEGFGYLIKQQERSEGGRFSESTWKTSDPTELPLTEKPLTENPTPKNNIIKEEQVKNNERIYTDSQNEIFEKFWEVFPKKVDKGAARRAWRSALKKADPELIIEKAKAYADDPNLPEKRFIKYPGSWLNAEAWNNPPLPERSSPNRQDQNKKAIEEFLNGKD
jgi:hypothetical protein